MSCIYIHVNKHCPHIVDIKVQCAFEIISVWTGGDFASMNIFAETLNININLILI